MPQFWRSVGERGVTGGHGENTPRGRVTQKCWRPLFLKNCSLSNEQGLTPPPKSYSEPKIVKIAIFVFRPRRLTVRRISLCGTWVHKSSRSEIENRDFDISGFGITFWGCGDSPCKSVHLKVCKKCYKKGPQHFPMTRRLGRLMGLPKCHLEKNSLLHSTWKMFDF